MATQNDSTTRTKLADAINSVVTMTDYETGEMVDAILATLEPRADKGPPKGSRDWMIADLARAIMDSTMELSCRISDVEIGSKIIGIEEAAKAIRCMISAPAKGDGILSPKAALESFQIHCEGWSVEKCTRWLEDEEWQVIPTMGSEGEFTITANNLPEKGVQHFVAERQFLFELTREREEVQPAQQQGGAA